LRAKSNYSAKRLGSSNYIYRLFTWFEDEAVTTMIFKKQRFFLLYVLIFFFLLKANLFGIVPFSTTVTMFLGVTLFFSITTQVGCIIINIFYRGFSVVGGFCPRNLEAEVMVLLVVIELISYLLRILSLAIRLFSNMFAGHCVIKILSFFILILVPF
jgi:F-type H+-transporting ATPase subunit a